MLDVKHRRLLRVHLQGSRILSRLGSLVGLVVQTELVCVVGKGCDEEEPGPKLKLATTSSIREPVAQDSHLKGTQAGDSRHHGEAALVSDRTSLHKLTLADGAVMSTDGASIVIAALDIDTNREGRPVRRVRTHGGKPKDDHEEIQR